MNSKTYRQQEHYAVATEYIEYTVIHRVPDFGEQQIAISWNVDDEQGELAMSREHAKKVALAILALPDPS